MYKEEKLAIFNFTPKKRKYTYALHRPLQSWKCPGWLVRGGGIALELVCLCRRVIPLTRPLIHPLNFHPFIHSFIPQPVTQLLLETTLRFKLREKVFFVTFILLERTTDCLNRQILHRASLRINKEFSNILKKMLAS